jgi:glycosyltransferase involved in cell wall biosynthesis
MVDAYDKSTGIIHKPEYIIDKYNPDVVMCHAHHPYLQGYMSKFTKCLKVMIAVDSWKMVKSNDPSFYIDNKFDLIVYRSAYDKEFHKKSGAEEGVWLPFSASEKEFYPSRSKRNNIVGFVGTVTPIYKQRIEAINILKKNNLIDFRGTILGDDYAKYLRNITVGLTSANNECIHGKVFEMMASGTVVLSPQMKYGEMLFGSGSYIPFKQDCSDIVEKASYILKDKEAQKEISTKAYDIFLKSHTDNIRIKELYGHITNMIEGHTINRIWDI